MRPEVTHALPRRDFLSGAVRAGFAAAVAGSALDAVLSFHAARADADALMPVSHWEPLSGGRAQCHVCPLHCVLDEGETCHCLTRQNIGGKIYTNAYSNPCVVRIDPVEKTPLNHVWPGEQALALAIGGCNLRCLYCQNWQESQARPKTLRTYDLPPRRAVEGAVAQDVRTICFTYTEPVAFSEYVRDVSTFAKDRGVRSILATAGFMEPEPLKQMLKSVAAVAMALKGFDDDYYLKVCGQHLAPVLKSLETAKASGAWLEITTLVVPTLNDDMKQITAMSRWIHRNLGADVPLHFARFVPEYRLKDLPRTPVATLEEARAIALAEGLKFVYLSNVAPHEGNRTTCPNCKRVLVDRVGFKVLANTLKGGACPGCAAKIPGLWS